MRATEYGHVHALHHFIGCVANGTPVAPYGATFEDGWRVQLVMEAITESSPNRPADRSAAVNAGDSERRRPRSSC